MRATLKSTLNTKHVFRAIKIWVVATIRYAAGLIKWTKKKEVDEMDRKTRKIITMYSGSDPRSNVEWLYLSKVKEVGDLET